jgi:hypothetical protein
MHTSNSSHKFLGWNPLKRRRRARVPGSWHHQQLLAAAAATSPSLPRRRARVWAPGTTSGSLPRPPPPAGNRSLPQRANGQERQPATAPCHNGHPAKSGGDRCACLRVATGRSRSPHAVPAPSCACALNSGGRRVWTR